jgi:hypothetical protein
LTKTAALVPLLFLACLPPILALASPIDVGVKMMHAFPDGDQLWLATEREGIFLADLTDGSLELLVEGDGLPTNRTSCGVSAFGRIWLGSPTGLYVLEGGKWERREGLPSDMVTSIAAGGGYLWVGTNRGVARYDPSSEEWAVFTKDEGMCDNWVLSISAGPGEVWFGTMRGGVCRLDLDGGIWSAWGTGEGLISNTVFTISASDDKVYAGTSNGLSVLDRASGVWTSYGSESLPSTVVYSVIWDEDLGQAWMGTGYGLVIHDPAQGTLTSIAKVGEVELEKINAIVEARGVIWCLRATNRWYAYRTSAVVGYGKAERAWVRPIQVEILMDQSGYGPGFRKEFLVQSNEPIEGRAEFDVCNRAGDPIYSGELGPRTDRADWDAYYWRGDFTELERRGNFTIRVRIGPHEAESHIFEIDNDVLIDECGELVYEFLRYMRCGVSHEYRSSPCHLDDGVLPNGTHIDATGGWHCAGIWGGKWTSYQTYVLFNLLFAHHIRPDYYGEIDRDGDGLGDILNEAMWGCDYLLKMQMENGSIHQEVEKVEETDGVIGTYDDRKIFGWMSNYNGLLAVAAWAGTAHLMGDFSPEKAEEYMEGARLALAYYGGMLGEGAGNSIEAAAMALACVQMATAAGNVTYLQLAEEYCGEALDLPFASYRGSFVPVALAYYAELNPETRWSREITDYVVEMADQQVDQWRSGTHLPFQIPQWELYLMDPWAAEVLYAYRLTGNRTYLDHALECVDCHLGMNPYGICYLEGTGSVAPPAYTSSFVTPQNPRGAVPGSIPQGIRVRNDRPYYDMSQSPGYESGETWLINTNFLQTISLLPRDTEEYPLEVGEGLSSLCLVLAGFAAASGAMRRWS